MRLFHERQADADLRRAEAEARSKKIDEQLAIMTADTSTRYIETDKLHEDIVRLSKVVFAHYEQIQSLTVLVDKVSRRVDRLYKIVRLTHDNGHNGRVRDVS